MPGTVAGLALAHKKYGKLAWALLKSPGKTGALLELRRRTRAAAARLADVLAAVLSREISHPD